MARWVCRCGLSALGTPVSPERPSTTCFLFCINGKIVNCQCILNPPGHNHRAPGPALGLLHVHAFIGLRPCALDRGQSLGDFEEPSLEGTRAHVTSLPHLRGPAAPVPHAAPCLSAPPFCHAVLLRAGHLSPATLSARRDTLAPPASAVSLHSLACCPYVIFGDF